MSSNNDVYLSFAALAKQYCSLIEDSVVDGRVELHAIRHQLLRLYLAAIELPDVAVKNVDIGTGIAQEEVSALFKKLQDVLPFDYYWDKFNPLTDQDEGHITSSLVDDLVDIWRDMEGGLRDLRANPDRSSDVWWEWRFSFQTHWGTHAIGALRAMHYALQDS